ncbi:ABC transporter permease [Spiroplasma floricola]|uniref:ABC transporter permease n=1 Tax=Spiroplasma floricola 23-6 TaxID=1336749 RepID=A0A2K8SE36_9MOLU|nr:FtsX-like permease family protein [Spiroplasma floricola]AUB31605.1 ABC transporter permease [Spiroplasma floricola 23-6]
MQKLFFRNIFKNIIKNKLQLVMVILLMFLSVFIFTMTDSSSQRLVKSREDFALKSNLHDSIIQFTESSYNYIENDEFKTIANNEVRDEIILNYLKNSLDKKNSNLKFYFDRTETRNFILGSNKNIKVINLEPEKKVDTFIVKNGMSLKTWKSYVDSENDLSKRWVYLSEQFAKNNNIKINDIIRLNDDSFGSTILVKNSERNSVDISQYENKDINEWIVNSNYSSMNWFQVVGYGSSADFMMPIISSNSPLPNLNNEGLAYVNPKNFGWQKTYLKTSFKDNIVNKMKEVISKEEIENFRVWNYNSETQSQETLRLISPRDKEVYYSLKFVNKSNKEMNGELNSILTDINKAREYGLTISYDPPSSSSDKVIYDVADKDYSFVLRTQMYLQIIKYFKIIMYAVTIVTVLIGIWILTIILRNNIQKTFGQNGILLSLGYKKNELIMSNCLYPFFISIIGGTLGYLLALPMQIFIINIFKNFFTMNFSQISFSWLGLLTMVIGLFLFLLIVTLSINYFVFNKYNALQMINYENISTVNKYKLKIQKFLTRSKKFDSRFKGAILASSISRLITITSVMLISSTITSIGVIAPSILNNYTKYKYIDNNYDNQIEYESPIYNAPTTFYKTYNPISEKNNKTNSAQEIFDMYLNNQISSSTFTPNEDVAKLSDLTYKNLNKDFLTNPDLKLDINIEGIDKSVLKGTLISSVWKDYKFYKLDQYYESSKVLEVISSKNSLKDKLEDFENLRVFYLKYKTTIGLNIQRKEYFENGQYKNNLEKLISNEQLKKIGISGGDATPVLAKSGRIRKDSIFEKSFYEDLEINDEDTWWKNTSRNVAAIYNWIKAYFIDNLQQGFLQGVYASSPEALRKIISESFLDESKQFNALFNIIPYVKSTNDLGIAIEAAFKNKTFKIYGLNKENRTQSLFDFNNNNLKEKLFEDENNIVLNSSLAKILKAKVGETIDVEHFKKVLAVNEKELDPYSWDTTKMDAKGELYTNSKELYSRSLVSSKQKGWKNKQITQNDNQFVYNTDLDTTSETMTKPTEMSEKVDSGRVTKKRVSENKTYKVVGISRQYGSAKAWVQNNSVKKIYGYDKSEQILFQNFIKEWINPKDKDNANSVLKEFIQKIGDWEIKNYSQNEYKNKFESFKKWVEQDSKREDILKLFESEYPIFNYKNSKDNSFADLSKGITVSQQFGDFSSYGLNGGVVNSQTISGYQISAIKSIDQKQAALEIMSRIMKYAKVIVYYVTTIFLLICVIIIMLIVNLVIVKYQKNIAVLKVLGYKNFYIIKLFIGMYIPIVLITTLIGIGFGILIVQIVSSNLITSGIVVPFFATTWWYSISTFLLVWIIYILASIISWFILKRINLLLAVQES